MGSVVRNYVWCLNDVDLRLASGSFFASSPAFSIGDSQCDFQLQFGLDEGAEQASVFLCRRDDDSGGPLAVVSFLLALQSASGDGRVDTYRSTFAFARGKSDGFSVVRSRREAFGNTDSLPPLGGAPDDSFVVRCETFNPSPTFEHISADVGALSEDLLRLLESGDFANARLVAPGGCTIPVHREILSVRSPSLERKFDEGGSLETPFPAPVVRAVLAFVYSGNVARVDFRVASVQQVLHCARHYDVGELADLLTPSATHFATSVDHKTETQLLQFDCFASKLRGGSRAEHPPVRMKSVEGAEMAAALSCDPRGKIDAEISLKNLADVKSVRVRAYLQDGFGHPWRLMAGERTLEPEGSAASWRLEHESEKERSSVFPGNVLRLWCEAKFGLSDEFSISDPDIFEGDGYEARCVDASRSFVRSMERLMESAAHSDCRLLLPDGTGSIRIPVHRSILAARSLAFRTLLETSEDISLDLPGEMASALLRYVYTGNLTASGSEAVCRLHGAAATFGMNQLSIACRGLATMMALDLKNVYSLYLIAVREGDRGLQQSCQDFIVENEDIVFGSFRWETFKKRHGEASDDIKKYVAEKRCRRSGPPEEVNFGHMR